MPNLTKSKLFLVYKKDLEDVFGNKGEMTNHYIWPLEFEPIGSQIPANRVFLTKESSDEINRIASQEKKLHGEINGVKYAVRELYVDKEKRKVGLFRVNNRKGSTSKWERIVSKRED